MQLGWESISTPGNIVVVDGEIVVPSSMLFKFVISYQLF